MSTRGAREPSLRGYRRRKNVPNLDLNNAPPPQSEGLGQVGTSNHGGNEDVQGTWHEQPLSPPTIDVDAIEDEVVESSASAFAEARSKSRRNHGNTEVVDVDLEDRTTRIAQIFRHKRRRVPTSVITLQRENVTTHSVLESPPPPTPPKEPTFSCPICMGPVVEEMSTKCGHIFCKTCIKAAIIAQGKCPTCRKKVTARELIRVFLPATR